MGAVIIVVVVVVVASADGPLIKPNCKRIITVVPLGVRLRPGQAVIPNVNGY